MEFSLQRVDLLKELNLTQGVVERKTTIPILSNILLEASGDLLRITATDLELGIRCSCPAKVKKGGATTVAAKKMLDYVRQLEHAEIKFKVVDSASGGSLQLNCGNSHVRMPGIAKDNFPVLPDFPAKLAVLPSEMLLQMVSRTIFAVSSEESRYTLNGALLLLKPETMTMVATDGHRLAHVESDPSLVKKGYGGVSGEVRILVPRKAMAELVRLLGESKENAGIEFGKDDNHLFFKVGGRLLVCRMLSGQFPNYEAVLPKGNDKKVVLDRDLLTAAVRRVSLFSDERTHSIRCQLKKDELKIISSGSDVGESEESLPVKYEGEALEVGFNWQYLLDFLAASGGGEISMEFKDEQSAGQLRPLTEENLRYLYVIMPMRI